MLTSFAAIEDKVRSLPKRTVAVPSAANTCALEAALEARKRGLADFILIDGRARLEATMRELGRDPSILGTFEVVEEEDCDAAARLAVRMVREGRAGLLGKGRLQTSQIIKAVLDKKDGLREASALLSDIMVIEKPQAEKASLVVMTDPALCVAPSVDDMIRIIANAVTALHKMGCERPRVAIPAALEVVKEAMPATVAAAEVARRVNAGEVPGCVVEGPLSMDIAVSPRAAQVKGYTSEVAGRADLLVVTNIEAGNVLAKTVATFTKADYGHLVLGARVPVIMSSRSDSSSSKFNSVLLGLLCAGR